MGNADIKNLPIGFFDSGVGGLSVYSRFRKTFPCENTIYFGDTKNLPYGNKTKEQLIGYARRILDFFKSKNVKAVVIACNTSSALAYDTVKNEYDFPIFPIIQSCSEILAKSDISRLIVFATVGTVSSHAYSRELKKYNPDLEVVEIACPNWVNIVEADSISSKEAQDDVKIYMEKIAEYNPDKVVLGCTHYPYLTGLFEKFYPLELFIDPSEIFVRYVGDQILLNDADNKGSETIYVSANPTNFVKNAKLFYDIKTLPTLY